MEIFAVSSKFPLRCHLSTEEYDGSKPNPSIPAMLFYDCNNGRERLYLIDEMLMSGWYQKNRSRMSMELIRSTYKVSDALFSAEKPAQRLLTPKGLINLEGLHGGTRRLMQTQASYSSSCPLCNKSRQMHQSLFINRQLKFGRIELSKWEIVQMKIEEAADFVFPFVESGRVLFDIVNQQGARKLYAIRASLHHLDHYVNLFSVHIQALLVLSLAIKGGFVALEKMNMKSIVKAHERLNLQVNQALAYGSILFIWKGVILIFDQDPGVTLIQFFSLTFAYLFNYTGVVKFMLLVYGVNLVVQAIQLQRELL